MATRHNVIFNGDNEIKFNKSGKLNKKCIKHSPKVYVHWDGYPLGGFDEETESVYGGALSIFKEFLNTDGARARAHDLEYLSAYYIGWKIAHDFNYTNLKSLDDFRGIGIETELSDWADYNYVIQKEMTSHDTWKFVINVLDYNLKLIKKVENINDLESYKEDFLGDIYE